jgi:hypothetical protein
VQEREQCLGAVITAVGGMSKRSEMNRKSVEFLTPYSWTIPARTVANSGGSHDDTHLALGGEFLKVLGTNRGGRLANSRAGRHSPLAGFASE